MTRRRLALLVFLVTAAGACSAPKADERMSFFFTSVATGDGGDLGGLTGADAHCQALAAAVGSHKRQWRAYLSVAAVAGQPEVHARDRIGRGPWFNAAGVQVAASVADLHSEHNNLGDATSLDERGKPAGFYHDMLTGSNRDGTLAPGDATCRNWTTNSTGAHAIVGHSNKNGSCCGDRASSWNSAHESRSCALPALQGMGGNGRFYCFAADE